MSDTPELSPSLLLVPDVLDSRIAALLPPADRHGCGGESFTYSPARLTARLPTSRCLPCISAPPEPHVPSPGPPPLGGSQRCGWPCAATPMPRRSGAGCGAPKASPVGSGEQLQRLPWWLIITKE